MDAVVTAWANKTPEERKKELSLSPATPQSLRETFNLLKGQK